MTTATATILATQPDEAVARQEAHRRAAVVERRAFRESFRARVRMSTTEWSDRYRMLSPEANAMAVEAGGPIHYDSSVTPYNRDVMNATSDPLTETVVAMFPSQDGKTEIINNFIGKRIHLEPGPMLLLQPTKEMAEAWSKDRLAPMVRDTRVLRGRVKDARSRNSDNTILHKKFPGGHITIVGSNSAAGLASRPIRDVLVDEVDRCAVSAGTEGDPIGLAFRRATTFRRGKKVLISSPTLRRTSRIYREYMAGTQERMEVPCPHCGEYQEIKRGDRDTPYGFKWDADKPETVYYLCAANACVIEERHKGWMIDRYRYAVHNPGAGPTVRSFWKNAWTSKLISWVKLVREWLKVHTDPLERQQFVNTVDCELYDPSDSEELDAKMLFQRLEPFPRDGEKVLVPARVAVLVRLVDTQDDRLETAVWGFGEGEEAWRVDFEVLEGRTSIPLGGVNSPWNTLKGRVRKTYMHETGVRMIPQVTFVDLGGHATAQVYAFTKAFLHMNVFAIKGANTAGAPLLSKPHRHDAHGTIYYMVGSFAAKEIALRRFTSVKAHGPGYIHLFEDCDGAQLEQFTNEHLERVILKGRFAKREWVKHGACEQFHLLAYAYCALEKLGINVKRQLGAMARQMAAAQEQRETDKRHPSVTPKPLPGARPPKQGGFTQRWKRW